MAIRVEEDERNYGWTMLKNMSEGEKYAARIRVAPTALSLLQISIR